MVFGGIQAFNLVSILLFLLPGLMGVKVYLREVNRSDRFNRIDTIALSFVVSLLAFLMMYLWYWISLPPRGCCGLGHAPRVSELEPHIDSLPEMIWHYAVGVGLTLGGGYWSGRSGYFLGFLPEAPNRLWRTKFEAIQDESDNTVRIVTVDGERLEGKVEPDDWTVESRNLVVNDPKRVVTDREKVPLSDKMYLHQQDISRVYFENPESADETSAADVEVDADEPDEELDELEERVSSDD
jgi:hypothetical protein